MVKSVDKIVKGLEKLIKQLDICSHSCSDEMALQSTTIHNAEVKFETASGERNRAIRIRNKLSDTEFLWGDISELIE